MGGCLSSERSENILTPAAGQRERGKDLGLDACQLQIFFCVDKEVFVHPRVVQAMAGQLRAERPETFVLRIYSRGQDSALLASKSTAASKTDGLLQVGLLVKFHCQENLCLELAAEARGAQPALLGSTELQLDKLITAPHQTLTLHLSDGLVEQTTCTVRLSEATEYQTRIYLALALDTEHSQPGRDNSESILALSIRQGKDSWRELQVASAAEGTFPPFELTFGQLDGDLDAPLRLQLFRAKAGQSKTGKAALLQPGDMRRKRGTRLWEGFTNTQALQDACAAKLALTLSSPQGQADSPSVQIRVVEYALRRLPSFLDYLFGGCRICWMAGIDFSAASAADEGHASFHRCCEDVIAAIGSKFEAYTGRQGIPVWGFSGCVSSSAANACYPLNGNSFQPGIHGLKAVLNTYRSSLQIVNPQGPTAIAPLVKAASEHVHGMCASTCQAFGVVTIMLAGPPSDPDATLDALGSAAGLPVLFTMLYLGSTAGKGPIKELVKLHMSNPAGKQFPVPVVLHDWAGLTDTSAEELPDNFAKVAAQAVLGDVPANLLAHFRNLQQLPGTAA